MNIQDAKKTLELNTAEIEAVIKYTGFSHANINLLTNFNAKTYYASEKEGWNSIKTKEEMEALIEDFVNIYSAICKLSTQNNKYMSLSRGTGEEIVNVNSKNEITNFLSTSTDENIAKRFSHIGEAVLINIDPADSMILDVDNFKKQYIKENTSEDEKEFLIAPFTKIEKMTDLGKNSEGYHKYICKLKKGNLKGISKKEEDKIYEEILESFDVSLQNFKREIELDDRLKVIERARKNAVDKNNWQDIKDITEDYNKNAKEYAEISDKNDSFKNKILQLVKSKCANKQKEIEQAKSIVNESDKEKKEEENRKKEKQERELAVNYIKQKISKLQILGENIKGNIALFKNTFLNINKKVENLENGLGLDLNENTNKKEIVKKIDIVNKEIDAIIQEVSTIQNSISSALKDNNLNYELDGYDEKLSSIKNMCNSLSELSNDYRLEQDNMLKEQLYSKVQMTLKNARIGIYAGQIAELENQKSGIFDRLTGKDKLRKEQIKNLQLKIQIEQLPVELKDHYSIKDMLGDIYYTSKHQLYGSFSNNMTDITNKIFANFGKQETDRDGKRVMIPFSEKDIEEFVAKKEQEEYLKPENNQDLSLSNNKYKGPFADRKMAKAMETQNENRQRQINEKINDMKSSEFNNNIIVKDNASNKMYKIVSNMENRVKENELSIDFTNKEEVSVK